MGLQLFSMPLPDAASALGISATALKSASRKLGIYKWPYMCAPLSPPPRFLSCGLALRLVPDALPRSRRRPTAPEGVSCTLHAAGSPEAPGPALRHWFTLQPPPALCGAPAGKAVSSRGPEMEACPVERAAAGGSNLNGAGRGGEEPEARLAQRWEGAAARNARRRELIAEIAQLSQSLYGGGQLSGEVYSSREQLLWGGR